MNIYGTFVIRNSARVGVTKTTAERTTTAMTSSLKFMTLVTVLAIGAGVLGSAQDALSSEKTNEQVAAIPSAGEEAGGHGIKWGYEGKIGPSRWAKLSKVKERVLNTSRRTKSKALNQAVIRREGSITYWRNRL